jgi:hypothetical protein
MIGIFTHLHDPYHLAFYISCLYISHVTSKYSDNISSKCSTHSIPSYDLFNYYFGAPLMKYYWLADASAMIMILLAYPYIHLIDMNRFYLVNGTLLLIRALAVTSTIGYISMRGRSMIKTQKTIASNCHTDLVVSGHSIINTLIFLNILQVAPFIYTISILPTYIFCVLTALLIGDHYTSDIILGIALSILTHHTTLI